MFSSSKIAVFATCVAVAQAVTISTPPSLTECQPAALQVNDGTPPFYISILPAGQPSAQPLEQLPTAQSSPVTWTVDLPAGTNISLSITDSNGTPNYSSSVVILKGSTTDCLKSGGAGASGSSASASGGSGSSSASATSNPSGSASGGSSGPSASKSGGSSSTSGAATLTKETSGALFGLLSVVAAVMGVAM